MEGDKNTLGEMMQGVLDCATGVLQYGKPVFDSRARPSGRRTLGVEKPAPVLAAGHQKPVTQEGGSLR